MNLTKTFSTCVSLGYIFPLRDLKLPDLKKTVEKYMDSFIIISYLSVALNAPKFVSFISKKNTTSTIQIFSPNIYFCVAITSKEYK